MVTVQRDVALARDYRRAVGDLADRDPEAATGLWHGNIEFLLRRDTTD